MTRMELKCALSNKHSIKWIVASLALVVLNSSLAYSNYENGKQWIWVFNIYAAFIPMSMLRDRVRMAGLDLKVQKDLDHLIEQIYKVYEAQR